MLGTRNVMGRRVAKAAMAWCVMLALPTLATASTEAPPPFSVGEQPIQLGYLLLGQTSTTMIELKNEGDEPFTIQKIITGCNCTKIEAMNNFVPAGGSTTLVIDHEPYPYIHGWTKAFRIQTIERPDYWYQFVCRATCGYAVQLNKGASPRVVTETGNITAQSIDGQPFRITSVHGQPPVLQDFNPATDELRNNYIIEFDLEKICPLGTFGAALVMETDHPDAPMIAMLLGNPDLRRSLDAQPQSWRPFEDYLLTGNVKPGGDWVEHTFTLKRTRALEGELPTLNAEMSGFDGEASPREVEVLDVIPTPEGRDGDYDVTVRMRAKADAEAGFFENVLVISQGTQFTQLCVYGRVGTPDAEASGG